MFSGTPRSLSRWVRNVPAMITKMITATEDDGDLARDDGPVGRVHGDVGVPAPAHVQRVRRSGDLPDEITGAGPPGTVQERWNRAARGQGQPGRRRRQAFFDDRRFDGRGHDADLSPASSWRSVLLLAGNDTDVATGVRSAPVRFTVRRSKAPGRPREQALYREATSPAPPASAAGAAARFSRRSSPPSPFPPTRSHSELPGRRHPGHRANGPAKSGRVPAAARSSSSLAHSL